MSNKSDNENNIIGRYSADDFDVLVGLEAIRVDTTMYINSTGVDGIMQLLVECIDNVVDESKVLEDVRKVKCSVKLLPNGMAIIEDNGRGIPVEVNKKIGKEAVYISFEHLHGGAKLKNNKGSQYGASIGVHGIGLACVNALSDLLIVTVKRQGKVYQCEYQKGVRTKDLHEIGTCDFDDTGTKIQFLYDSSIMQLKDSIRGDVSYPFDTTVLKEKLSKYALFNSNVEFELEFDKGDIDDEGEQTGSFLFSNEKYSIVDMLKGVSSDGNVVELYDKNEEAGYEVKTYLTVTDFAENIKISAVNGLYVKEGGVHEEALKHQLCEHMREIFSTKRYIDENYVLSNVDILAKVSYVIELTSEESSFTAQVKNAYNNPEIGNALNKYYLVELKKIDTDFMSGLIRQVKGAYDNKVDYYEDLKKKKELKKPTITAKEQRDLFEDFFDCESNHKAKTELWIFEGNSAANGFVDRDVKYQGYIQLVGKVINSSKATPEKVKNNKQYRLLQAIATRNKFGKYVLCTDADIDGKHIRSLFIKLVIDWFPQIINEGRLYIAIAPLYKIKHRSDTFYVYSDADKDEWLEKGGHIVRRYKGIGEMFPEEFMEAVVNDKSKLVKINHSMLEKADLYGLSIDEEDISNENIVEMLMGPDTSFRKAIVASNFCDDNYRNYMRNKKSIIKKQRTYIDPMSYGNEDESDEYDIEYGDIDDGSYEDMD